MSDSWLRSGDGTHNLAQLDDGPGELNISHAKATNMFTHPSNAHCILLISSELAVRYTAMRHCIPCQLAIEAEHRIAGGLP
jgi:hypothetical protein